MSEESQSRKFGSPRRISRDEALLIERIIEISRPNSVSVSDLHTKFVQEMPDGGMGSLYIEKPGKEPSERRFGRRIGELLCKDSDGVTVIISLNVDTDGDLFELDFWKTDFTPVKKIML